ncbi:iron-siderophore ABC transporter substrate-binding protein [Okibacterium endophyticum]
MPPRRPIALLAASVSVLLALSGCAPSPDAAPAESENRVFAEAEADAYPVTIPHALGETTITSQPQRVVVIGWAGADLAVQLGTVPIAQGTAASVLSDDHYPWFEQAVDDLGAPLPAVDPSLERGEVDLEFVLAQEPDLILAINSGITEEEYGRLSEIAPTVAYPDAPWAGSVDEHLTMMGAALGQSARASQIEQDLADRLDEVASQHPEFEGVTYMQGFAPSDDGQAVVYGASDPRSATLTALGLEPLPGAVELQHAAGDPSSYSVSLEELLPLTPDLFVTVSDQEQWQSIVDAQPAFASWAPVAEDRVALITDLEVGLAFSTATPLGIDWAIERIADDLSAALAG